MAPREITELSRGVHGRPVRHAGEAGIHDFAAHTKKVVDSGLAGMTRWARIVRYLKLLFRVGTYRQGLA